MKKIVSIIPIILVLGLSVAFSQKVNDKCVIRGWVQDKELRKSIQIYKVPSWIYAGTHNDPFNGYLDNSTEPGEEKPVEIIGFKSVPRDGQWIELRKATDLNGKVLFEGDGWIESERVTARVWSSDGKAAVLYSMPKLSSKKIGTIPNKTLITIIGFDCFGLKVKYKGKSGWLPASHICGDPQGRCS